ncbi:MAG TPA: alpha/beta fold hydrolase [Mycobacteriales bacterium]|nr:alpha/beta fold hydrolase [Mycobacteriales bacterium]
MSAASLPRRTALVVAAGLLASSAWPAFADPGHGKDRGKKKGHGKTVSAPVEDFCSGGGAARPLQLRVDGQVATGLYAVPKGRAKGLVVYAHGYGHTVESWRKHLTNTAARDGVIAVAMNYRGEIISPPEKGKTLPTSRGWQVREGAADSNAAAQLIERRCSGLKTIVLYGISMGGNTAGLALAAKPTRANGSPLYDYWFQMEGAANVIETYVGARALKGSGNKTAVNAVEDIEREMGGTFESKSSVYAEHAVVNRVDDIAASGVKGVVLMHGVGDGLVPYNQSRELHALLLDAGLPAEMHTFLTRGASSEPGTTLDGYVTGNVPGYTSPFAGHASEASETHILNIAGFSRLSEVLGGAAPDCAEYAVDGTTGQRYYAASQGVC